MAVHPLRPATYHRLGEPLPHQQANRTQSSPAASLFIAGHMRAGNCIRYYQSFPSVIPVCRVSSLRVTHPSALARLCKHRFAKDLHVLSILSAFILSQDQTLHSIYFHIFNFTFCLDENLILQIRVLDINIYLLHLLLLLFLYHCPLIPFCIDKIYIIIIKFICQLLFFKKFGFFVIIEVSLPVSLLF